MITTVVTNRTFRRIADGEKIIYFRHKPHWEARFERALHNSIILLSGHKSLGFRISRVENTGGSYAVHLGESISPVKQEPLFPAGAGFVKLVAKRVFVPGAVLV
jgi:hypothetical protein